MLKAEYEVHDGEYNIVVKDDDFHFIIREIIADYINMDSDEYIDIMINKFNGKRIKSGKSRMIVFSDKKDVSEAVDWYESMLVMDKLINPNN